MDLKSISIEEEKNQGKTSRLQSFGRLTIFFLLAVNITFILGSIWMLVNTQMFTKQGETCMSEQCINTASDVLRAMDRSADPCQDFYQYACGAWMKDNPVPEWTATWDRLAVLRESLLVQMRQLLESEDSNEEPKAVRKAKLLYRTCMNTDELEREGLEPIKRTLRAVGLSTQPPGLHSLEDNENATLKDAHSFEAHKTTPHLNAEAADDWLYTVARSRRLLGINIFYGFNVAEDVRNSSLYKIVIEQISPGFGEKFLLQSEKFTHELTAYRRHMVKMLTAYSTAMGMQLSPEDGETFAGDVVDVATQIAQVMTPAQERRSTNHLFHEVTLSELEQGPPGHEKWHLVNWTRYLDIVFNDTAITLDRKQDKVILLDLFYMQRLASLFDRIDPKLVQRFIWWNVFVAIAPLTIESFRTLGYEFSRQLYGLKARTPRWKGCTNNVNANFGLALSYAYVRTHLTQHDKESVLAMLDDVRAAFEEAVHRLDWMDGVTREKTLSKLHAIRAFVGYPGWIMNATQLDNYYKQAHVIEDNLFDTFLNLTNAAVRRTLSNLRKKPNRNRWVATATTVNAFYSATLNSVTFPAGILRPPFYGNGIAAIDYGGIGAIMGHEVTHGFDDQGRRYDEHGNLKQWWSLDTLEHYHNKVRCIIDQYSNYSMPELGTAFTVQGVNTQGENIADNGGLRAAYVAYRRLHSRQPQRLPGLPHVTDDQLFFLGFAQIWCGNSTRGALKSKLVDGVHAPNRVRVLGTLANSAEFAAAWHCPAGAPMNPRRKCVLW